MLLMHLLSQCGKRLNCCIERWFCRWRDEFDGVDDVEGVKLCVTPLYICDAKLVTTLVDVLVVPGFDVVEDMDVPALSPFV